MQNNTSSTPSHNDALSLTLTPHLSVLQEHVQGFRQPTEMSLLLSIEEICELDRVTNRYIDLQALQYLAPTIISDS